MNLSLYKPTSLTDCEPIVRDIKMGDAADQRYFLGSLAQYIGLIESDSPREKGIWEIRFAYNENDTIGTTGWYEWPPLDKEGVVWLSWFGIRKQYERKGYGRILLQKTIDELVGKYKWLYVFTDDADKFYEKCGFEKLGSIRDLIAQGYPGINEDTGFNLDEIVLRRPL